VRQRLPGDPSLRPLRGALRVALAALLAAGCARGDRPDSAGRVPGAFEGGDTDTARLPAVAMCRDSPTLRLLPLREQGAAPADSLIVLEPDSFGLGPARVWWTGDLNNDGLPDLILRFPEACGNWGECPEAVVAGCGGARYALVWEPEYVVGLTVDSAVASGWRPLVAMIRTDRGPGDQRLEFVDGRYRWAASPNGR
jgi:hypothetical protein